MKKIIIPYSVLLLLIYLITFSRTGVGVSIYGFKLGELIVGASIINIFYVTYVAFYKKQYVSLKLFEKILLVFLYYCLLLLIFNSQVNLYSLKQFAFVLNHFWYFSISFYIKENNFKVSESFMTNFLVFCYLILTIKTISYDAVSFIISFFAEISDKPTHFFKRPEQILISVSLFSILISRNEKKYIFLGFTFYAFMLFQIFGYSRAVLLSFVFSLLFGIIYLSNNTSSLQILKYLAFTFIVFISSFYFLQHLRVENYTEIYRLYGDTAPIEKENLDTRSTVELSRTKDINDFRDKLGLSIENAEYDQFIESNDTIWRLSIWRESITYQTSTSSLFIFGLPFSEPIPSMLVPGRGGTFNLNENVHNFLITAFVRTGAIGLLMYILFLLSIFIEYIRNINDRKFFIFFNVFQSVFITAFFDVVFESVTAPILFFIFIGILTNINFEKQNLTK